MYRVVRVLAACALMAATHGCAIHPLPEDITRDTTLAIVRKIRCEAREALQHISIQRFRDHGEHALAAAIERNEITVDQAIFENFNRIERDNPQLMALFNNFSLTGVAFDYRFDITSEDGALADANFRMPFTEGLFSLNVRGGKKLERENERKFLVVSTFYDLHNERNLFDEAGQRLDCESVAAHHGNIIYPITGKIGLEELFNTYIDLQRQPGLKINLNAGGIDAFTDKLVFTTTLSAGVTPKIELDPLKDHKFRLADAKITADVKREDIHQVAISLDQGGAFTKKRLFSADGRPRRLTQNELREARDSARENAARGAIYRRTEDFFARPLENERRLDRLEN